MNKFEAKNKWILDDSKWESYFSITNWKKEGGIIMAIALIIPLVSSLLFMLLNGGAFSSVEGYVSAQMVISIGSSVGALLYASRTKFFKEYKVIFFFANLALFALSIVIVFFKNIIDPMLLSIIVQTIYQIIIIVLAFIKIDGFRRNFISGFQNQWITILLAIVIAVPLMYLWSWGMVQAGIGDSNNQNSINDVIDMANNSTQKVFIFILLFFFVIAAAPIFEELTTRYFIALFSGNRWVTLVVSGITFATLHTTATGDFAGLPMYIFGSFIMSAAFTIFGSIGHSISIHIVWNLISYITIVVNN